MSIRRIFEIVGGVLLIVFGLLIWVVPGPWSIPLIIAGVMLISPHHGRRVAWWFVIAWKHAKQAWHERTHGKKSEPRTRRGKRKRKIWPFND